MTEGAPDNPDDLAARHRHDLQALAEARRAAKQAMAALLAALLADNPDALQLQLLADLAHRTTGRLWEALAHVNET